MAEAACPRCKTHDAQPVKWTLWGGVLGPRLLSHVKCPCGATFNGKTGADNTMSINIFVVVSALLVGGLFYMLFKSMR